MAISINSEIGTGGAKIIRVSSSKIGAMQKALSDAQSNLDSKIGQIEGNLDNISEAWRGSEASKYISSMQDNYCKYVRELSAKLEGLSTFLGEVPAKYAEIDSEFCSKLGGN